jgi:hypothetical protein
MKRIVLSCLALCTTWSAVGQAQTTTIGFDNVASGTTISNQYAGLLFSAPTGFRTATVGLPLPGVSPPNFLCSTPLSQLSCVGAFTIDFLNGAQNVSIKAVGLDGSGTLMSIGVFGAAGLLGTVPVIGTGTPNTTTTLNFASFGQIQRLQFTANTDGIGWDDLIYSAPTVVPEPSALAMMTVGLGGLVLGSRRKRRTR